MDVIRDQSKLGAYGFSNMDVFLEKFQTSFDPSLHFWKIMMQFFFIMDMVAYLQGGMRAR